MRGNKSQSDLTRTFAQFKMRHPSIKAEPFNLNKVKLDFHKTIATAPQDDVIGGHRRSDDTVQPMMSSLGLVTPNMGSQRLPQKRNTNASPRHSSNYIGQSTSKTGRSSISTSGAKIFPLFFDTMQKTAANNQVVTQSRFSFQSKQNLVNNARSVADLALRKFEDELKSGKKYNDEVLD